MALCNRRALVIELHVELSSPLYEQLRKESRRSSEEYGRETVFGAVCIRSLGFGHLLNPKGCIKVDNRRTAYIFMQAVQCIKLGSGHEHFEGHAQPNAM